MSTPCQRSKSFSSLTTEMEISPVSGLAQNLGGLRTDSGDSTPLPRGTWPQNSETPELLPPPKWPRCRKPSPEPSPTIFYGLLRDIGNKTATQSRSLAEGPHTSRSVFPRKPMFSFGPSTSTASPSLDKENIPCCRVPPQCSSPSTCLRPKPRAPIVFAAPRRQDSEDSGFLAESQDTESGEEMLQSFQDSVLCRKASSTSDIGIQRLSDLSDRSKDEESLMEKCTSWESSVPTTSTLSSFLGAGDSEDGFPATFEEFFQDMESQLPRTYEGLFSAPLYSAPLSASVPGKNVMQTPPFGMHYDCSPENSKEQIRRRLLLGSDDEVAETSPTRQQQEKVPTGHQLSPPSTPLSSLQSVLNCNISTVKNPFKRPVSPGGIDSLLTCKRQRGDSLQKVMSCDEPSTTAKVVAFQRCHSENEASIKLALQKSDQEPDLIGDFSKPYALPLMKGKHDDLKMISPVTLVEVLEGKYNHSVKEYVVVDCRYPYEYEGGHIRGAVNIYTPEDLMTMFLSEKSGPQMPQKVLVFHCEFSSERGPKLSRFLRNVDRQLHNDVYPRLTYPEIYVLEGGYKAFYEDFKSFCVPQQYVPMRHKDYESELREFRARSKSGGSTKGRGLGGRSSIKF